MQQFSQHLDWQEELAAIICKNEVYLTDLPAKNNLTKLKLESLNNQLVSSVKLNHNATSLCVGLKDGRMQIYDIG